MMAVIREESIGNTKIRIHDDACRNAAPEDVQRILERIAERVREEAAAAEEAADTEKPETKYTLPL